MDTKKRASLIKEKIEQFTEEKFKLTHAYEVLAVAHGYKNWHVMSAKEDKTDKSYYEEEVEELKEEENHKFKIGFGNIWKTPSGFVNIDLESVNLYEDYYSLNLEEYDSENERYVGFDKIHFLVKEEAIEAGKFFMGMGECEYFSVEYTEAECISYVFLSDKENDYRIESDIKRR